MHRNDIEYQEIVRVLHDYTPTEPGCLSLKKGDLIYVQTKADNGWWMGVCMQETGWFPSNWIEPVASAGQVEDLTELQRENKENLTITTASTPAADNEELPPHWRSKKNPKGVVYYYNTQTNATTYDISEVRASSGDKRKSIIFKNNEAVSTRTAADAKPLPARTWIPGPKTLLGDSQEVTWEILINNILKSIADLNYSAKNDIKALYLSQANQIVRAIRDMLACSGTISADSHIIKSNRSLAAYHTNIMSSLSKIILAAKIAAGLWPPPDGVHTMRYQAGQVLLAVRHFVAVAQDLGIQLQPITGESIEFDIKGNELSDSELVSKLDQNCEIIVNSIAALVTKITRDRALSTALIEHVRKTVTEIGQFMSLIEGIQVDKSMDTENLVGEFLGKKDHLYNVVNELVTASSTGEDGFAPANALGMMLESATSVLEAVEEMLVASKLLIDHKELIQQKSLTSLNEEPKVDSELANLQKRAQSLTFLDGSSSFASDRDSQSGRYPPQSPQTSWGRDQRTVSADSRIGSRENLDTFVSKRKSSLSGTFQQRQSGGDYQAQPSPLESASSSSKLSQFFGEDAVPKSARLSDQNGRPWFLKKETHYDISYNMEGAVNGGSFQALVERLTVHDQPVDPSFASSFLMTFHLFGTAEQLFSCLKARFSLLPPPGLTPEETQIWADKKLGPIQVRVCNTIKTWIESYWLEKFDDNCLDDIHAFASGAMMQAQPQLAQRILELVSKRVASDVYGTQTSTPKMKRIIRPEEFQPPILPKSLKRFTLLDLDPMEVARQLTLIEMDIFLKIQPVELMKQEWSRKNTASLAVNVRAMSAMSTKITGWVICTILQEADLKRRSYILKYFIKVGDRCLTLNNFHTLMAIQSAFNSSTISRLKKTWELLSNKTRQAFEVLKKATDHSRNYADYRAALKRAPLPALPFLGLFLTDLTFTDDGNQDMRGKLINFDKYAKTARIINDLMRYQVPYPLTEVAEIQDYLLQSIQDRGTRDAQDLYELSLRLEPRDERASATSAGPEDVNRELEAKIEMLQKAGML